MGRGTAGRWLRRALSLGLVVSAVAGGAGRAGAVSAGEVAVAQRKLDQARSDAHGAALAYLRSEHELADIEDQLTKLEAALPKLRAQVRDAHEAFDANAVALYTGSSSGADVASGMFGAQGAMDVARATTLASSSTAHASQSLDGLRVAQRSLETRERAVRGRHARQKVVAEDMKRQTAVLEVAMRDAGKVLRKLQAEQSVQDYWAAVGRQDAARRAAEAAAAAAAAAAKTPPPPPPPAAGSRSAPADPDAAARVPVEDLICPVQAPVTFINDWGQPRSGWRVHEGTDVFAARGSKNVAIANGVAIIRLNKLGGNAIRLEADDGHAYYYAHLDHFAGKFNQGKRRVKQGDLIGYSGNTGNAAGGPVHTHFEIHPDGKGAVNPFPALREMCAEQLGLDGKPPKP